jgi:hypothetical protein
MSPSSAVIGACTAAALAASVSCSLVGAALLDDGSGGSGGGAAAAGVCSNCSPAECCGDACADLTSDALHCGACDVQCAPGQACYQSLCIDECPSPLSPCGTTCVDLTSDPENCGACGRDCLSGRTCEQSVCDPPWATTNGIGAPLARQQAAAVWTGSRFFVWGGRGISADLADGGLYDPETDAWEPTEVVDALSARVLAAAVWSGSWVLLWGGGPFGSAVAYGDGKIFKPSPNKWQSMSGDGAPSPRRNPVAVWTGTRMLIWGGEAAGLPVGGGGTYDPDANAWAPIDPGPSARSGVAHAWSGSELVVFGGRIDGTVATNEGHAYDPGTGAWSSLGTSGDLPAPRYDAFAAWQGSSLFVFGGRDNAGTALSDGARYDPITKTWSKIASPPGWLGRAAPSRQSGWTAWTGTRTLLVGGVADDGEVLLDGAAYDPAADAWPSLVPPWASGNEHLFGSAAWTGMELIVWSGLHQGILTPEGDRYLP